MLPTDAKTRKEMPMARGLLDYFPDALAEVANVSRVGNEQHNPGQPMHWAKEKSTDEADCIIRHLIERGTYDSDGLRHAAKVAWRALAMLQREIDAEDPYPEGCEKCEGWTWDCHKKHHTGEVCGHECEYPITASESSVYASAYGAGTTAAMNAAGRGDERLNRWCDEHGRWFNHVKGCPECNFFPKAGSSR